MLFIGIDDSMAKALQFCIIARVDFYFSNFSLCLFQQQQKSVMLNSTMVISGWNLELDYSPPISHQ